MRIRIISGKHKGRTLKFPKKLPVRATTDIAKEALFSILENRFYFDEISVLDLFGGSGNISFEFASRGVENTTVVEKNRNCTAFISDSAKDLSLDLNIVKGDVFDFLKRSKKQYDIIFADPPYDLSEEKYELLINLVFSNKLLSANGELVVEHSKEISFDENKNFFEKRKYGNVNFSFFKV